MTTTATVRDALATAITTGSGLAASPYQLDSVVPPCAHVFRREMDPRMIFTGAKSTYEFGVRIFTGRFDEVEAQRLLDELVETSGERSVVAAIQDGDNWTATIDYAQVVLIGEPVGRTLADETFMTVDLDVEVVW